MHKIFLILERHSVKYQFGSTPDVGCQDRRFTIKKLLHLRHNHNLPTWVLFTDLVKDFNTSNHQLMHAILVKYGFPPKLRSAIARIYKDSTVISIIVIINTSIPFKFCVKQGDIMAPVLFLFVIMDFDETLEKSGSNMISINSNYTVTTNHRDQLTSSPAIPDVPSPREISSNFSVYYTLTMGHFPSHHAENWKSAQP